MIRRIRQGAWLVALFMACQWLMPANMTPVATARGAVAGVTCNATMTSINFGNVDPNNFQGNYNLQTTGYLTYYCTNTTASAQTITACFSIGSPNGANPRAMTGGVSGDKLTYNIYQDAANSIPWGSSHNTTWGGPRAINVTVPANGASPPATLQAYASIDSDQGIWLIFRGQLSADSYVDTYANNDVALDIANGANASCASASYVGNQFTFNVTANVQKTCQVTTDSLNFTNTATPSNSAAQTTLTVTCTNKTKFRVGLDNGKNYDGTNRRMRGGPTHNNFISYGLYQDSNHATPWGNIDGTDTAVPQPKNSTGQPFTIYGQIKPGQGSPPPGDYFDAVTVYVYY